MEKRMWKEKRYFSLDAYLRETFGEKVYKVSLNGGMTCPNRDGTLDTRGCIFCSAGGSGDFAAPVCDSVTRQIDLAIAGIRKAKTVGTKFIAYFQSYTNTYAEVSYLKKIFTEAMMHPDIVALSIGTRPDCLGDEVLSLLASLNEIKPVWVELGLQTIHERTARFIRRGYELPIFEKAVADLNRIGVQVIVHVIVGLPFESRQDLMATIQYLSSYSRQWQEQRRTIKVQERLHSGEVQSEQESVIQWNEGLHQGANKELQVIQRPVIQGIKLQLLHVLRGTDLEKYQSYFKTLSLEEYVDIVIACIEHLPQDIVVHRITGDGPKALLLAPLWSASKKTVMNTIHREMKQRDSWQGKQIPFFTENTHSCCS